MKNRQIINLDIVPRGLGFFDPVPGGVFLRTDIIEHPILKELWESSLALFWTVKVVDFSNDANGFRTLPPVAQRIFKLNNGYQHLMDSGVANLYFHLVNLTNSTEVALSYGQIGQMEQIHGSSYIEGLTEMFGPNTTKVIDEVKNDHIVRHRLDSELDYSDQMLADPSTLNIFKTIGTAYLLEDIKFPFSFFTTLTLNKSYGNAINGFSQLISRIAKDELEIHVPTNKYILKRMMKHHNIPIEILIDMADIVLEQELEWVDYLLAEGNIPGLNHEIARSFLTYFHNKALRDLGADIPVIKPNDFVAWFHHARDPDNKQVSQQEASSTAYQRGTLKNDLREHFKAKRGKK